MIETAEHGGYPLFDHLHQILEGPIVWSPGVNGAVVVSQRGGDFLFEAGQDLAVGYDHHDDQQVHLYIVESFSFRVATPEAAVAIARLSDARRRSLDRGVSDGGAVPTIVARTRRCSFAASAMIVYDAIAAGVARA